MLAMPIGMVKTGELHIIYTRTDAIVTRMMNGKNWRVTHNIHGKIHNELLNEVLGSNNGKKFGITSMRDAGTPQCGGCV